MRDLAGLSGLSSGEQSRSKSLSPLSIACEVEFSDSGEEITDYSSKVCNLRSFARLIAYDFSVRA